jgi:hypothetical protein
MIQEGGEAKDLSAFSMLNIEILDCFSHYTPNQGPRRAYTNNNYD